MKSKGLIALLAVSCVAGSLSAVADTYYLTYQAKSASSGYLASGANYVKAGGKSRSFLLVKMTGTYAGDFSGLGDAVYLATDPKSKVAVEETTNVQLRQYFDTKDRALLFGMAYNIDNPQADPHAGAAPPATPVPATAVTCKDQEPYGSGEYFHGAKAKFLDIGLISGGTVAKKLVVSHMRGQDSSLRCNSPVSDNFAMSAETSFKLDLDRTRLVNTSGPTGAPPATLESALTELEKSLHGGGWTTL